ARRLLALQAPPGAGDLAPDDGQGQGEQLFRARQIVLAVAQPRQQDAMDRLHQVDGIDMGPQQRAEENPDRRAQARLVLLQQLRQRRFIPRAHPVEKRAEVLGRLRGRHAGGPETRIVRSLASPAYSPGAGLTTIEFSRGAMARPTLKQGTDTSPLCSGSSMIRASSRSELCARNRKRG